MESQMKIQLEQKNRKRGRPSGRNRVPLTTEQRRARNAQYERERRDQQAQAIAELADAMGCEPNMSNADIIATVVCYLGKVSSKTVSNDDLRRQNETMIREIGLLNQQWGLAMDDESSDTSDSGVIVGSAESEAYEYESGDSSSRSESRPCSTSSGYSQSSASCGQGPASYSHESASFGQGSASHETVLGICQGPVRGSQNLSYDQAWASYNQSAAKRFKTTGGYVEVPVSFDSASYVHLQPPASFKQERASDEESSTRYVQESADYSQLSVSCAQGSASYVDIQPPVSYKQELASDEEGTAGCKGPARTRPYVKSAKRIILERAASAASFVSETLPPHQHGLEGSMPRGLTEEPSVGSAEVPQGSWSQAPNTWHQAQPQPWTQASQEPRVWPAHEVPSPQVPPPQTSPSSDPWIDTLIRTYLG